MVILAQKLLKSELNDGNTQRQFILQSFDPSNAFLGGPAQYPLLRCFGRLKAGGKRQAPVRSLAMTSNSRKSEAFRV